MTVTAGDMIAFRGNRRFVLLSRSDGLLLERIRRSRFAGHAFYHVSEKEKTGLRVVRRGRRRDALRARRMVEGPTGRD